MQLLSIPLAQMNRAGLYIHMILWNAALIASVLMPPFMGGITPTFALSLLISPACKIARRLAMCLR